MKPKKEPFWGLWLGFFGMLEFKVSSYGLKLYPKAP